MAGADAPAVDGKEVLTSGPLGFYGGLEEIDVGSVAVLDTGAGRQACRGREAAEKFFKLQVLVRRSFREPLVQGDKAAEDGLLVGHGCGHVVE